MDFPRHKTKIVCTIGPASRSKETLKQMIHNGMNVARINFSHGDFDEHEQTIATIRAAAGEMGKRVAILTDLAGPKIRIGDLAPESVELERDKEFILTTEPLLGNLRRVSVNFPELVKCVHPGQTIFLSDGFIQLVVEEVKAPEIRCRVMVGGVLRPHKGLNLPGADLGISAITAHDRECLAFAMDQDVDAISISFVQGPEDIDKAREIAGPERHPFFIAKIERSMALENFQAILQKADGIMVARGDLGVEIPIQKIGITQKKLIHEANLAGKPVITATQMLESMVSNSRPTRAEVTDVTNAILDGTDCIMLSEESAMGDWPVEAVAMMSEIARITETNRRSQPVYESLSQAEAEGDIEIEDLIALSVRNTVARLTPAAVITPTESGHTARLISRFRLPVWITALSVNEKTCQRLQFSSGVHPFLVPERQARWEPYVRNWLKSNGIEEGLAVLTQGPSTNAPDQTNRMEIIRL